MSRFGAGRRAAQPPPPQDKWKDEKWDWPLQHDEFVQVHNTNKEFEVDLDMAEYTPEEVKVDVLNDEVLVHCAHGNRRVGATGERVARDIQRAYHLPPDVDTETVNATHDKQGHLVIKASKK